MDPENLKQLRRLTTWDTPTICNGLEIIDANRRGHGFTHTPLVCLDPDLPPMVGYARTATIRAAAASSRGAEEVSRIRMAYYEYVAGGATPRVAVIQDVDPNPGFGAFWGEVNTTVHKGLGVLGVVTNGSFRDLPDNASGFQVLGGQVGPSHGFVHVVSYAEQVNVAGMTVSHDDIIHADRHGAVVVPAEMVAELPRAIERITRREAKILEAARSQSFHIEALRAAMIEASKLD